MSYSILQIIVWLIVAYGTTQIITDSVLFQPLKDFIKRFRYLGLLSTLLDCFLCASVWVCFLTSVFIWSPTQIFLPVQHQFFIDGMFGSCVLWFLRGIENKLFS